MLHIDMNFTEIKCRGEAEVSSHGTDLIFVLFRTLAASIIQQILRIKFILSQTLVNVLLCTPLTCFMNKYFYFLYFSIVNV